MINRILYETQIINVRFINTDRCIDTWNYAIELYVPLNSVDNQKMFWQTAITTLIFTYSFPPYNLHVVCIKTSNCFIDVCVKLVLNGIATPVDYYYRFTIDSQLRKGIEASIRTLDYQLTLMFITHITLLLYSFETRKCFCVLLKLQLVYKRKVCVPWKVADNRLN